MRVKIMLTRKEGVSPLSRKSLEKRSIINSETKGVMEKIRLIFRISFRPDLPAMAAPAADVISHEPRKTPAISSYPPVIFIISFTSSTCTEVLVKPAIQRLEMSDSGFGRTGVVVFAGG
jgi:hypothetical protein